MNVFGNSIQLECYFDYQAESVLFYYENKLIPRAPGDRRQSILRLNTITFNNTGSYSCRTMVAGAFSQNSQPRYIIGM